MEKFSLNDLLSLLLPGFISLLAAQIIFYYHPFFSLQPVKLMLGPIGRNDLLMTAFYIILCIITGACIQGLTFWVISRFRKQYNSITFGLYKETNLLFGKTEELQREPYLSFFDADCKAALGADYKPITENPAPEHAKIQGAYFDHLYYYVITRLEQPEFRVQQSYYFLFRNLFTVSFLTAIVSLILFVFSAFPCSASPLWPLFIVACLSVVMVLIVRILGIYYRKRMVRYLFLQYYMLKHSPTA